MSTGTVKRMLGQEGYEQFKRGVHALIAEIDRQSVMDGHRFTLKKVIGKIQDLPFRDNDYILFCYVNRGRAHLLSLTRKRVLKVDTSSTPYVYYRTSDCEHNPRLGPDIDYIELFQQKAPFIRAECEQKILTADEGTEFVTTDLMKAMELPYPEVPAIYRKYLTLMINILTDLKKAGYLTVIRTPGLPVLFRRTSKPVP